MSDFYTRAIWPVHEIDGDTTRYLEDDGRRSYTVRTERDLGINTPELHDPDPTIRAKALDAKTYRRQWFITHLAHNTATLSWPRITGDLFAEFVEVPYFVLRSAKPESFDRWLSEIYCQAGHNLQQALLDAGLAVTFTPT